MFETILSLTKNFSVLHAGNPIDYSLDPYVVLSPAGEGPSGHGFWVQLPVYGCAEFIQPVQMACY
jgi:hypothetical protein